MNLAEEYIRDFKYLARKDKMPLNNKELLAALKRLSGIKTKQKQMLEYHKRRVDSYLVRMQALIDAGGRPVKDY